MSISNLNIQIIGRIGQDATVRQVKDYFAISFSVAVSEKRKEDNYVTAWFNCTYWTKSDKIAQYITKGKLISVVSDWFDVTEKDGKTYTNFRVKDLNPFLEKSEKQDNGDHTAAPYAETPKAGANPLLDEDDSEDLPF